MSPGNMGLFHPESHTDYVQGRHRQHCSDDGDPEAHVRGQQPEDDCRQNDRRQPPVRLAEDGGTFTGHHIRRRSTHGPGQNSEEYGRISWCLVFDALLYPDSDEQSHRQAPYQQVRKMSLDESMCQESPYQCGEEDRWDVVPILDRGGFQSEQRITDHAANEPGDDSSDEHCQQRQPAVPAGSRTKGGGNRHRADINPGRQRVKRQWCRGGKEDIHDWDFILKIAVNTMQLIAADADEFAPRQQQLDDARLGQLEQGPGDGARIAPPGRGGGGRGGWGHSPAPGPPASPSWPGGWAAGRC